MFLVADRVKQTSLTSGFGDVLLNDTFGGFQSFQEAIGDGNSTYYTIENGVQFEIGIGTYTATSNTLSRDFILVSSNNNLKIALDGGISIVFCTYPADKAFLLDAAGYATSFDNDYHGIKFPDDTLQTTAFTTSVNRSRPYTIITENTAITTDNDIILMDATSHNVFATLPTALAGSGYTFTFKKIAGNYNCIIYPASEESIDDNESVQLFHKYTSLSLFSDSNQWHII